MNFSNPLSARREFLHSRNDENIRTDIATGYLNTDRREDEISNSNKESDTDLEAIMLANKEIGVGNIDPIQAQQKELLLLSINHTQTQLEKLNKFTSSMNISKLPDKGAKVFESIKQQEEKLTELKAELEEINGKTMSNTRNRLKIPIKRRSDMNISLRKPLTRVFSGVEKNSNTIGELKVNNIKRELTSQLDLENIPNMPETLFDVSELGARALAKLNEQKELTYKRLKQLHGSLVSRPSEDQRSKDPRGLNIPLMPHQQHALAWIQWRETQEPNGGILADDMGLGKTLTMISLVLATVGDIKYGHNESKSNEEKFFRSGKKDRKYYGGTLIICPASLIKQWEAEVKIRCKQGFLTVLVYHGQNRNLEDTKLSKFNIVITTYQTIIREAATQSRMYQMEWNRIILDEAHYIRNYKSKACIAVCSMSAKKKWALTGTPIQNKEEDLYAILNFLKCSPFDNLQVWKRWIDNKNNAGKERLIIIMKSLMLRRTKQELQSKGALDSLPDKNIKIVEINMDKEETLVYQKILLFSRNLFAQFLAQRAGKTYTRVHGGNNDKPLANGTKTQFTKAQRMLLDHHKNIEAHEILVLLLRLRQMCCHPALIHSMLDKQDNEFNSIEEEYDTNADLLNKLQNISVYPDTNEEIEEHIASYKIDKEIISNLLTKKNPVFDDNRLSSKVGAIVQIMKEILKKEEKLIVVSQWTSYLKVIAQRLDNTRACYAMFTGEVAVKHRQSIIDAFNDPKGDINILFLSLTAGGVGLNLVGANHLLLVDIHWNPQLEQQAQDRIYRFGQKKNVYIYKFICKDTIEERVKNLQEKKMDIANHVLTGTRSVSSKLTVEDLKSLFS